MFNSVSTSQTRRIRKWEFFLAKTNTIILGASTLWMDMSIKGDRSLYLNKCLPGHLSIRDSLLTSCQKGSYSHISCPIININKNHSGIGEQHYIPLVQWQSMWCIFTIMINIATSQHIIFQAPIEMKLSLVNIPNYLMSDPCTSLDKIDRLDGVLRRIGNRMHCKMVFNFTIRHDHAFKSCQTRWPLIGLRNLILIGQLRIWWNLSYPRRYEYRNVVSFKAKNAN